MEDWEKAEHVVAQYMGYKLTSGSGRGYDKGDAKDEDWRLDTKSYKGKSYAVNHEKMREWRRNAARLGHSFYVVSIPIIDGQPSLDDAHAIVKLSVWKAVLENQKE